jgi:hypothetical protein
LHGHIYICIGITFLPTSAAAIVGGFGSVSHTTDPDPAPDPSIIKQKIVRKTLISTVLRLLYDFLPVFPIRIRIRSCRIRMFLGLLDPHPDSFMDPRIWSRIRTKMPRIHNTGRSCRPPRLKPPHLSHLILKRTGEEHSKCEVVLYLRFEGVAELCRLIRNCSSLLHQLNNHTATSRILDTNFSIPHPGSEFFHPGSRIII